MSEQPAEQPNGKPRPPVPKAILELPVVTAASLAGKEAQPRPWHVPDVIPGHQVTQLGGDGGVGKSMVALQLGVATVIDKQWLGMSPRSGPVIYLSAEDDLDELHRRLEAIAASYGVDVATLTDLHLVPVAGLDAVLGAPGGPRDWVRTARGSGPATSPRLDTWATACVFCGRDFEINMRRNVTPETSDAFKYISCEAHRLTRSEQARMSRRDWRAEFVQIRQAKLEADAETQGSPPAPPAEQGA